MYRFSYAYICLAMRVIANDRVFSDLWCCCCCCFCFCLTLHGGEIYSTPATNHQPPHLCYYRLVLWGPIYERAYHPPSYERTNKWISQMPREKKRAFLGALHYSPLPVVLRINRQHRFSIPFERLAGGHLVQGTSSLLLIACDHAFRSSSIDCFRSPFCICRFTPICMAKWENPAVI